MAYYSLPRLERINCSMHWESGILRADEQWLAPKFFLSIPTISNFFLNQIHPTFMGGFVKKYVALSVFHQPLFSYANYEFNKFKSLTLRKFGAFKILTYYIYMLNNQYNCLFFYNVNQLEQQG